MFAGMRECRITEGLILCIIEDKDTLVYRKKLLGRSDANYLCTPVAKMQDTIDWGYNQSLIHKLPDQPFGLSEYNDRVIMEGDK